MNRSLVLRLTALVMALAAALVWLGRSAGAVAAPATGAAAPDFRLQDQHATWVSLAEQRGKWLVVYFYPMDETPGCTTEACEFRDNIFAFSKLGVKVFGISVQDVASKQKFAAKHNLPFPVLADTDKSTARAYGVLSALGYAKRETFVIDPQGRIARHYADVDPATHSRQLLADLQALIKPAT